MDSDFARLLGMNHLARAFGCGLKPELEEMLLRHAAPHAPGVVPLNAALASSGPAQTASDATLAAQGIPRFGTAALRAKDGTHG